MQRQQEQQSSRIDLADLKGQIVKRIGTERSRRYFYYLSRLLTQKLGKNEFDKLCVRIIGKENLSLHNLFIRSILKNACDGKVPPAAYETLPAPKAATDEGHKQSGYAGLVQGVPWSNGVVSPKKSRSGIRDRKLKDRPGSLGSNGALDNASHLANAARDSNGRVIAENGDLAPCDYQRPVQQLQGFAEQPMSGREAPIHQPSDRHGAPRSVDREDALRKDGLPRLSLRAPLGIPFCRSSLGGSRKPVPAAGVSSGSSCYDEGSLPDTESLQKRMEQIAVAQGLEGVSLESANILNSGLDLYLKRLITSCVSLAGGRSGTGSAKQVPQKQQLQSKLPNGLLPGNHHYMQNNGGHAEALPENRLISSISMLDFKAAMELNPQQLGEDWPLLMERIYMDQFPE
uniref:Transcriptional coactivator Hfi1/Transcriptional adapter 1 n=1 Tax=Kalanchoe fedtschenkoi TaxID=63787 RepID=A0A7N0SV81_KALFE